MQKLRIGAKGAPDNSTGKDLEVTVNSIIDTVNKQGEDFETFIDSSTQALSQITLSIKAQTD